MSRNETKRARGMRQQEAGRRMMLVFAAVFFIGLALQITMVVRLMQQNKRMQALEHEITQWSAQVENLELAVNQYKRLDRVAEQAARLGMEEPTGDQIRVVNVPELIEDTSAQGAGAGAGE